MLIPIEQLHNLGFMFQELRDWQLNELIEGRVDIGFFVRSSVAKELYLDKYYSERSFIFSLHYIVTMLDIVEYQVYSQ